MSRSLAVVLLATAPAWADDPPTDKLNKTIPALPLTAVDGTAVKLAPAAGVKATVVVFVSFDCPVSTSYSTTLAELAKANGDRGVRFVAVAAGDESLDTLKKHAAEYKLGCPLYADRKLDAVEALKAVAVPEAFVLDHNFVLRYRGRIDDAYAARLKKNPAVTKHDLRDAIEAVLAGKDVPTPATLAVGCPIDRKDRTAQAGAAVTFHRDVEPILQAHCQGCHRPGQVGPFPLTTYKQAVSWADDLVEYTANKKMPPWKPHGGPGYANDRQMPDKDVKALAAWVAAGCPKGDEKDAPPPAKFSDEWHLGKPDLVLEVQDDFHVGPTGRDLFRCFVIPTGLTEDRYITAFEVKPGNPRVVHHTLNFWDASGKARQMVEDEKATKKREGATDFGPGYSVSMGVGFAPVRNPDRPGVPTFGAFGGWAPGQMPTKLPDGAGFFIAKGADVVIQTHYHRTGKAETDRLKVGLYFAPKPVEKVWQTLTVGGMGVLNIIPAGKADYTGKGSAWILDDATVYSVMPHMHLIGKKIKVTMTPPEGKPVVLVDVPEWDYNWQETYWLKAPIKAKAGTRFDVEAVYDNSAANPNNPSHPPKMVFFGEQTTNEMLFGFIGMTPDGPGRVKVSRTKPKG